MLTPRRLRSSGREVEGGSLVELEAVEGVAVALPRLLQCHVGQDVGMDLWVVAAWHWHDRVGVASREQGCGDAPAVMACDQRHRVWPLVGGQGEDEDHRLHRQSGALGQDCYGPGEVDAGVLDGKCDRS